MESKLSFWNQMAEGDGDSISASSRSQALAGVSAGDRFDKRAKLQKEAMQVFINVETEGATYANKAVLAAGLLRATIQEERFDQLHNTIEEMYASVVDKDWYSTLIDAWLDGMSEALARESEADRKKAEAREAQEAAHSSTSWQDSTFVETRNVPEQQGFKHVESQLFQPSTDDPDDQRVWMEARIEALTAEISTIEMENHISPCRPMSLSRWKVEEVLREDELRILQTGDMGQINGMVDNLNQQLLALPQITRPEGSYAEGFMLKKKELIEKQMPQQPQIPSLKLQVSDVGTWKGECVQCKQPVFQNQERVKCTEGYLHRACHESAASPTLPPAQASQTAPTVPLGALKGICVHCARPVHASQARVKCNEGYLHRDCHEKVAAPPINTAPPVAPFIRVNTASPRSLDLGAPANTTSPKSLGQLKGVCIHCSLPVYSSSERVKCDLGYLHAECCAAKEAGISAGNSAQF